ncbi:MAG: TonB-dependent receptor, partial [Steroidobacteraceae bacterium]
ADSWQGLDAFGAQSQQNERVERDSQAVFGHLDYEILDAWTISLGARHSWDETKHRFSLRQPGIEVPPLDNSQKAKFQNNSYEAGTQYQLTPDHMVYFRYAEGYRGGGFVGLPGSLDAAVGFGPETSKSYEVGFKTQWLENRLLVNITLFDVKFKDMQRDITQSGPNNTFVQVTANAADATTKGIEFESFFRPVPEFTVHATFGYLKAEYTSYESVNATNGQVIDLSDTPMPYAPEYTASGSAEYTVPFNPVFGFDSAEFFVSYDWRSKFTESNTNHPSGFQDEYGVASAAVSFDAGDRYKVTLYGDNLFDKRFITLGDDVGGLIAHAYDNIGRTYGAKFGMKF